MDMKDYLLKKEEEIASDKHGIVWAFDLGKGSIGEAVRRGTEFLHKESLLIPAEFAETKTAASRRRMFRTRQAHKAREQWLEEVMRAAGIEILKGRQIGKVDAEGKEIPKADWNKKKGKWVEIAKGDPRLEREFPATGDDTCYTSCLLRIKLMRGEKLEPWQVFKAFHSAIQKRGYGKVAWARREQKRQGKSEEEIEKASAKKDPAYQAAVDAWPKFKQEVTDVRYHFPAYYDAAKMGLWNPKSPEALQARTNCQAQSTSNVRFGREDLECEILLLAANANRLLNGKLEKARETLLARFKQERLERINRINQKRTAKNATLPPNKQKKLLELPSFEHMAASAGEFILYGPTGKAYASYHPDLRRQYGLKEGGENDWQGVLGQKIPRFDNRIINDCSLLPRFQVCTVHFRLDGKGLPKSESLLAAEVTFLWKLKNLRFTRANQEKKDDSLTPDELKQIFDFPDPLCYRVEEKTWRKFAKEFKWDDSCLPKPIKLPKGKQQKRAALVVWFAEQLDTVQVLRGNGDVEKLNQQEKTSIFSDVLLRSYELTPSKLCVLLDDLNGKPLPAQSEVEAPKPKGRSRFSRPALRLLREFVLSGLSPNEFRREQETKIPANADPKKGLTRDDLKSFCAERMGDSWQGAYVPNERLAMQVMRAGTTRAERDKAINDLIGEQNDPIVRHRLITFAKRITFLENAHGKPAYVALEFVRDNLPESFLGQQAQTDYGTWARERQKEAKEALEIVKQLGCESRDAVQKYLLLRSQGFQCVYLPNGSVNVSATQQQVSDSPCIYTEQKIGLANLDDLVIEHIVPQQGGYNGPDAFVNKVVTTRHVNEQMKKCRTPFEWFQQDMPEKWAAYVKRVSSLQGTLGKKKVRLLTQADAPELVQKYTALAETAWISKLAQAILCIHFGWPFALDEERRRKITVISGGLTGRIRRMYDLNRVLNPDAKTREEAQKKNRADNRHHALDAMVISFIPSWAHDTKKENFFRFPEPIHQNPKGFFEKEIQSVKPRNTALQKPVFEDKFYGQRNIDGHNFIVGRENLASLAIKKTQNSESIRKISDIKFARIVDVRIQKDVRAFWDSNPTATLEAWKKWCADYRLGANGSQVKSLMVTKSKADAVEEYKNVSKSGNASERGQFKRGAKHRGYFIYERPAPTRKEPSKMQIEVCPVFVFQSKIAVQEELLKQAGIKMHGYFESGCQVRTQREWEFQGDKYPADEYILGSVWSARRAKLRHPAFGEIGPVGLKVLFDAGFERI
jgi:CRISPR-associated endonuclease Csn1